MKTSALINQDFYPEYEADVAEVSPHHTTTEELLSKFGATLSRSISRLSDDELTNLENNYRRHNKTTGGAWDLYEVLEERVIRNPDAENPEALINAILGEYCYTNSSQISHKMLWYRISGYKSWKPKKSKYVVQKALDRVTEFCVYYKLPIFSLLVGSSDARYVDDEVAVHIFDYCKKLGADVGDNTFAFAAKQLKQANEFIDKNAYFH